MNDTHLAIDGFTVTAATTDAEIDAQVLEAGLRRVAESDAKAEADAAEWRTKWTAEITALREECRVRGGSLEHLEHWTSRLVPEDDARGWWWWEPFEVTAETSDAAIALVVDGAVDRRRADGRADELHDLAEWADAWTEELRQLRDGRC